MQIDAKELAGGKKIYTYKENYFVIPTMKANATKYPNVKNTKNRNLSCLAK